MSIKKRKKRRIFYIFLGLILLVSVFMVTYLLLKYNILPTKYLIIYSIVVGLIPILLVLYTVFRKKRTKIKGFFCFLEIIYIIVLLCAFFYLNKTFNFLDDFTHGYDYETKNYYIIALGSSYYNDIDDLKNKSIGYSSKLDESAENAIKELNTKIETINKTYDGLGELFTALEANEIDGMLLEQSSFDILVENDETINDKYKIIYQLSIKEIAKTVEYKDIDVTKDPFNVYISGIDSYGSVTDKTRSDVNILMSVNPKTRKILMVNIPRDYYVELAEYNQKDKLTHAGKYGIDVSVKTIEKLLDTEINYYVKVNYNALIKLVDALDGVDVYSEYNFYSAEFSYRFVKGENHVNGKKALDFVRTRKAFQYGDRVRGENQQRMIQAIIKKSCSPSILLKYDNILKSLEGSFTTNFSTEKIMSIINMQLNDMSNWNIESISVNGSDAHQTTYSTPSQELYVMIPDEETVNEAKNRISEVIKNSN